MSVPAHENVLIAASATNEAGVQVPVAADVAAGKLVVVSISSLAATGASLTDSQGHTWDLLTAEDSAGGRGYFIFGAILTHSFTHAVDWIEPTVTGFNPVHIAADSFSGVADAMANVYAQASQNATGAFTTPTIRAGDLALAVVGGTGGTSDAPGWTLLESAGGIETFYIVPVSDGTQALAPVDGCAVCALKAGGGGLTMLV